MFAPIAVWLSMLCFVLHRDSLVRARQHKQARKAADSINLFVAQSNVATKEHIANQDIHTSDVPTTLLKRFYRSILSNRGLLIALAIGFSAVLFSLLLSSAPEFSRAVSGIYSSISDKLLSSRSFDTEKVVESATTMSLEKPFVIPQTNYVATIIDLMSKEKDSHA